MMGGQWSERNFNCFERERKPSRDLYKRVSMFTIFDLSPRAAEARLSSSCCEGERHRQIKSRRSPSPWLSLSLARRVFSPGRFTAGHDRTGGPSIIETKRYHRRDIALDRDFWDNRGGGDGQTDHQRKPVAQFDNFHRGDVCVSHTV